MSEGMEEGGRGEEDGHTGDSRDGGEGEGEGEDVRMKRRNLEYNAKLNLST